MSDTANGIYGALFLFICVLTMIFEADGFWTGAFAGAGGWNLAQYLVAAAKGAGE
jgi:hypothetical protein